MNLQASTISWKVKSDRKPYHKPQIEKVSLALTEAVLGSGCKTENNGGPDIPECGWPSGNCYDTSGS